MNEWRKVRLGDVLSVKHGYPFPGEGFSDDPSLPIVVTPGNFAIGGGFKPSKVKSFNGVYPEEYLLSAGDLIVTMTDLSKEGATLGLPAMVPSEGCFLHNQRIGLIEICDPTRIDLKFLNYYLRTADYRSHILGTASGSTVRHTSPSRICDFVAMVPSVSEQRAISRVLGAIDDKIDANDRVIGGAESLMIAQAGAASARTTVVELAKQRKTVLSPESFEAEVAHFSLPAFDEGKMPDISSRSSIKSGKILISEPCVLVSKLNPRIPRIWDVATLPSEMCVASTEFVALVPNQISSSVLWATLSEPSVSVNLAANVAGTSGSHQRVKPAELLALHVKDPRSLAPEVRHTITELGSVRHWRRLESSRLRVIRDQLLPLLMSGKVRVREAEKIVEEVV